MGITLVAGLAAVAPSLPYASTLASAPAFFRPGGDVEKLPAGSVILVTPFSNKESTDAMYWQAVANYRFRMPEGDAFTPGPYLGPHPSFMEAVLNDLDAGQAVEVTADVRARFVADLKTSGITGGIVVGPSPGETAIVSFLTAIEGSPRRRTEASMSGGFARPGEVAVVPQLEDEQSPELLAVVAPAGQMVADQ